jgi:hypothetical protein
MWFENDHNIWHHDIQQNYFEKYKLSKMTISLGTMQRYTVISRHLTERHCKNDNQRNDT